MKRLVVCCDGTWQNLETSHPTNVIKITQAIKPIASDGKEQSVFYHEGVGAGGNTDLEKKSERIFGGFFGKGIDRNIQEGYRFLSLNYNSGDEIYLFGFSRGSYTVRSLVGMIYNSGLLPRHQIRRIPQAYELYRDPLKPDTAKMVQFREQFKSDRVPITLLGCWETVGSLGVPDLNPFLPFDQWKNEKYQFHDVKLSPIIKNALHGVAIDEPRRTFSVTPMQKSLRPEAANQRILQIWFPGDHNSVGGGDEVKQGLADGALKWMMESVAEFGLGLEFDGSTITDGVNANAAIAFPSRQEGLIGKLISLTGTHIREIENFEDLHESVKQRWRDRSDYRPANLEKYKDQLLILMPRIE